ncbi:MAG: tRNA (adenosine(37)-N6)-threonylcarbamoyltransferase complex ATPase subunit type 1 TsaE [Holophaga sp.]|nr:tRNA (adenosine(37)-N6)-threonylcarbamoyltransferase complex ATPase subunit type 1 TsaE [Holophaga sp.]
MNTERVYLIDEEATEALGARCAAGTPPGGTWLLRGELGAGKTTWTRGFLAGLGGDPDQVASPTYAVLHRYDAPRGRVFHLDLYRLGEAGSWSLGLEEQVLPGDFLVVEWAGRSGPWPTDWVAVLTLTPAAEGRDAEWTLPGDCSILGG